MKRFYTFSFFFLVSLFAHGQTEPTKQSKWQTTVDMGIQAGRVQPDQPSYSGNGYGYYTNYYNLYPQRPTGNRIGLTIHAFSGYRVQPRLTAGLATGVDYYNNSAFIPVAAAIQGDIARHEKRITPFYSLESGYAFRGPNPHGNELKGGWLWSPGVGIRINKGNGTGFLISAGYKHQRARQEATVDGVQVLSQVEYRSYNRLYFRMGFSF